MKRKLLGIVVLIWCVVFICGLGHAQSPTEFTYQGKLLDAGTPTTNYDFEFRLYDSPVTGALLGTQQRLNVPVSNGVFAVKLDFGNQFTGAARYLRIDVKNAGGGVWTILAPRQPITSAPYATNSSLLGGLTASGFIWNDFMNPSQDASFNIGGSAVIRGLLGVGTDDVSSYSLEVGGRSRFRQGLPYTGGTASAGFWLYQNAPAANRAFIGMQDDNNVGFYGDSGAGWGLTMNTITGNVGIGTAPNDKLEVNGFMRVNQLSGGGTTQLCRNGANQLSLCGSSLRYKTNIAPFFSGLSFIRQLRPITFSWIEGGMQDVGFGAEDVAKIDPLFVTYNEKGEVEGVKYDRIGVVAVNAIKEQQAEIDALRKTVEHQSALIEQQQRKFDTLQSLFARITLRRKSVLKKSTQAR